MHRCPSPGSCLPALTRQRTLLATSLIWFAGGCGPGAATPMPEPPSISPTLLGPPTGTVTPEVASPGFFDIEGGPHAAPANATVQVTNLDTTSVPYATTASADGHFSVLVAVDYGNELRFEWLLGNKRSLPTDVLFLQQGMNSFVLQPSPRFDCVKLTPGLVLGLSSVSNTATLDIHNECTADLSVNALSLRRNLPDFVLPANAPQAYAPGTTAAISVSYAATGSAPVEDTLFVQLSEAGTSIRYPVTLSAKP